MNCPKCESEKHPMEVIKQGGVEVDRCYSCKGIWFDEFELETLKMTSLELISLKMMPRELTSLEIILLGLVSLEMIPLEMVSLELISLE